MTSSSVRPPAVAGSFYDASPENLRRDVERFLAGPAAPPAGPVKALIAPHAGYVFSGPVAGSAFRLLAQRRRQVRRVVLLGPAHRVAFAGLALPGAERFATPLGTVEIDAATAAAVARLPQVSINREAHADEHSLEVELPFLQVVLETFSLLPLVVGRASPATVAEVLEVVWGGPETVVVVSSDLSHYLSWDEARRRDRSTAERILAGESDLTPYDACGCEPINGLLTAAAGRDLSARLIDLRNSGDTAGDRERVVGYCAIAFSEPP